MSVKKLYREMLNDITDVELAFGTAKFLPDMEVVPDEFKKGNAYTKLVSCIFYGNPLPAGSIVFNDGFEGPEIPPLLNKLVMAHLRSYEPKHEDKIAGIAFLLSQACALSLDVPQEVEARAESVPRAA